MRRQRARENISSAPQDPPGSSINLATILTRVRQKILVQPKEVATMYLDRLQSQPTVPAPPSPRAFTTRAHFFSPFLPKIGRSVLATGQLPDVTQFRGESLPSANPALFNGCSRFSACDARFAKRPLNVHPFNLLRWNDVSRTSRIFCHKIATFSQF